MRKVRLLPDAAQRALFRTMFGAHRFFFNKTKSVCDKARLEGEEARVAELVAAKDDQSVCRVDSCANEVSNVDAGHRSKRRWFCEHHVDEQTFGSKPRIRGVSRPYEKQLADFDGVCRSSGCAAPARPGEFRCTDHVEDGKTAKDPKAPALASPFNFHAVKSLIVEDSSSLQDDEKWQVGIPCNTKTAAVKQYTSAAKATLTKRSNGDTEAEFPGWKSKKAYNQEFVVRDNAISFRKAKAKSPPTKRKRGRRKAVASWTHRRSNGRMWELRIFPTQKFDAAFTEDVPESDRASKRPIRLKRCDMVRLKKAMAMGISGSSSDFCEAKVIRDRANHFHLCLPIKVTERDRSPVWESQAYRDAFLDPGGRTFQELYSPDGISASIGDDFYARLMPTLLRADRLMGDAARRRNEVGADRNYFRMLLRAHVLRTKVRNVVRDLHRKTARFLCVNFKGVFIPDFSSKQIATGHLASRINSKSIRNLMTFAHTEFRNSLVSYAKARNVHVTIVGEAFTTKTCTFCGTVNEVGSAKEFRCSGCRSLVHRDPAASRNIGLRTAMRA